MYKGLILFFLPIVAFSQQGWVNLEFQADQYGGESTWEIYMVGSDSVYAAGGPYENLSYNQQLITLPVGEYNLVVNDEFEDGICCEFGEGWFGIENSCGINTYVYDFASSQVTVPFNLLPCPPPVSGCTDELAVNYNPQAYFDSNDCVYNVTFRLDLNGPHPPQIDIPEVNSSVNGWCGNCWAMSDEDGDGVWEITVPMPQGEHLWKFSADEWEVQELPVGVSESPCFLFDEFGYVNRTINVQGNMMLPPFCWESCLPCGAIPGCTNPNASNWSPWANFDNGSCSGLGANCQPWETEITTILVSDNYPEETSFNVYNVTSGEELLDVSIGDVSQLVVGVPMAFSTCATVGDVVEVEISDSFGDGLGASQWGGQDGTAIVMACGDTLWQLPEADFGYTVFTEINTPACIDVEDVVGCGNPNYVEYNPEATIQLDLLCETEVVYGCVDDSYFNYDSLANTEAAVDSCFYTLTITDGVGDGWFGSWLGIYQDGWVSPQYKMGPNDGNEESFDVYLSSEEEIELFFFVTPQSQNQVNQCGFMLTGPTGDTLIDVPQWNITPFPNTYSVTPYCGNSCVPFVYGCIDEAAQNYMQDANTDDSSCYYNAGCTQAGYLEYYTQGYEADFDDGSCSTLVVFGCTDPEALNFDSEANVDNSTCVDVVYGCLDESSFTYNPVANTNDNSCCYVDGCTNAEALNYNEDACYDDGSCVEVVEGCMDLDAYNFEPLANVPDNDNCLYDAGCVTGPGNPYWLNDQCYAWVISVDPYCCESDWDGVCVELYEYCGQTVSSVDLMVESMLHIFPNPTSGVVNIQAPVGTIIKIFDAVGKEVMTTSKNRVELPASGVYTIVANYRGRIKIERIVRQ